MSDSEGDLGIFEEPEGFYQAEKEPSFVDYTLQSGLKLNLRLVGHNPLWVSSLEIGFSSQLCSLRSLAPQKSSSSRSQ